MTAVALLRRAEGATFRVFSCHTSCYGTVSSLNGEPEQGVAVEAVGQKDCSMYGEDTVTDEEGKFRLRGLLVRLCIWSGVSPFCQWSLGGMAWASRPEVGTRGSTCLLWSVGKESL